MGSTNYLQQKSMIFITLLALALAQVCLTFNIEGKDRNLCCDIAKQQCGEKCSGQLCSEQCEGRCGIFNTKCGPWNCQDIAGFSCTPTTTQAAVTAAACIATGQLCLSTSTGVVGTCCAGSTACTDGSDVVANGGFLCA